MKFTWFFAACVIFFVVVVGVSTVAANKENSNWKTFSSQNHCQVVGHVEPSTVWSTSGHWVYLPGRTKYVCDGGYTVERDSQ